MGVRKLVVVAERAASIGKVGGMGNFAQVRPVLRARLVKSRIASP